MTDIFHLCWYRFHERIRDQTCKHPQSTCNRGLHACNGELDYDHQICQLGSFMMKDESSLCPECLKLAIILKVQFQIEGPI